MKIHACENTSAAVPLAELASGVTGAIGELSGLRKVLVIHPDYSRNDYTHLLVPLLYQALLSQGLEQIDFLNAGGTHRAMTREELTKKLGLTPDMIKVGGVYNHDFDNPESLQHVVDISADFVAEKTKGHLRVPLPVTVNRMLTDGYDCVIAISGTVPHEAIGFSGGTKIFFPGISGPEVIALLHWAAVLIGVPEIIGCAVNAARDVVDEGTSHIFALLGDTPILSLNMVYTEDKAHNAVPRGLFIGEGFTGFRQAHARAVALSSQLHIIYIDEPKDFVVQQLPTMYDEVWTAGKGSYKLQKPGVLAPGGEIILFAPHIDCFHSNPKMEAYILELGYHGRDYVVDYCRRNPKFDKNAASHSINVRGIGSFIDGIESFPFTVTLATQIPPEVCKAVGLGYRDPKTINEQDFTGPGKLWIHEGGQWLYSRRS